MYQKRPYEKWGEATADVSRMNQKTADSLYQKLKEYLRTQAEDHPAIRHIKWLPHPDQETVWREPTFPEFLNHYNITILIGQRAGKEQ